MQSIGDIYIMLFYFIFPAGHCTPSWTRWPAVLWLALAITSRFFHGSAVDFLSWPIVISYGLQIVIGLSCIYAQIYRTYYFSTPIQRQQTKWVVYGITLTFSSIILILQGIVLEVFFPAWHTSRLALFNNTFLFVSFLFIPGSIGMAIPRSHLFDIATLINRALVYSLVSTSIAIIYFGCAIMLQCIWRSLSGQVQSAYIMVFSTLAVAALFNPLRHGIQRAIDRRFYRQKYDAAKTFAAFSARLRAEVNLEELHADIVGVAQSTLQPQHISLWIRKPRRSDER